MKIALIAENYFPTLGGIQEHVYHLAHWLHNHGHEVKIITGSPKVAVVSGPPDDPWVIRMGRSYQYGVMGTYTQATIGPTIARNLKKCFKENNFDLIHLHGPCDIGLPLLALLLFKGPKMATLHSSFENGLSRRLMKWYYRWVMKQMSGVIAVSELAASVLKRYADFSYKVIPNGVAVQKFSQGKKIAIFNDGYQNVLYIGRIEPRNGLDLLIQAFIVVIKKIPKARLLIAGSGPREEQCRQLFPKNLKDHYVFLGPVYDERPDLYATSDLFVVPARPGGTFSIMILEALAAKVPVVATPIVPEHQRNSHWSTVHVADGHESQDIAKTIIDVLSIKDNSRIEKGFEIVQQYDWDHVGAQIYAYYKQAIK